MRLPFQFNHRERIALCSVLVLLGALVVVEWGAFPVIRHRNSLDQAISTKTVELEEMLGLQRNHALQKQKTEDTRRRLNLREKSFSLFAYLDQSAGKAGIKEHIAYMKPSGKEFQKSDFKVYQVEMKLQSISLHQLSAFLYGVETADSLIRVKKASIAKTGQSAEGVDAVFWVETIAP